MVRCPVTLAWSVVVVARTPTFGSSVVARAAGRARLAWFIVVVVNNDGSVEARAAGGSERARVLARLARVARRVVAAETTA